MLIIPANALPLLVPIIVMAVLSGYSSYTDDNISTIAQEDNASKLKNGYNDWDNNNDYNSKSSSIENNGKDSAIANASSLISSPPSFLTLA